MNRIYRSIWNATTATFVAAPENTCAGSRKSSTAKVSKIGSGRFTIDAVVGALMLAFSAGVCALPTGGAVTGGSASISTGGSNTTITQTSQNAVINWQSFSIGATETVQFVQPSSNSVSLNRVVGSDPSSIFGSLSANGKVFLVNPNGILFGRGASVNVGGLVASTLNITDSDFMAGRYSFSGNSSAAVLNQGSINADGGYVALLGASVSNEGVISAQLGTVALVAGSAITLDVAGDGLLNVAIDQGTVNALVSNGGLIQAGGGQVLLSAQAAGNLLKTVVNNTGVIQAQTIDTRNGKISLLGDMQSGTVSVGGTLDVSGKGTGQTGGNVTVTGQHVGLFAANVDASGDAGGGAILVGGDYQGKNSSVPNASATYMSADSSINASAITNGNGGKAILWSNDSTRAYGTISAHGGALGGNGGLIETSGHWLDVTGIAINASAKNGKNGMWLLDPADVTISAGPLSNATLTAGVYSPDSGQGTANINAGALVALLNGGTDVTITTTNTGASGVPLSGRGDINVDAPLTYGTGGVNSTLTLNAVGDVNINSAISPTQGNLVVCCGRDINVNAAITMLRGSLLLSAGRDINQNAAITSTDGNIAMCAAHDVNVLAAMTSTNGTVDAANNRSLANLGVRQGLSFIAGTGATGPGLAGGGGAVNLTPPGGTITVTQGGAPGTAAPVTIIYNPLTYAGSATDFSGNFTAGTPLTVQRLVFPEVANKTQGDSTTAVFTGLFKADAANIRPVNVALTGAGSGTFNSTATLGSTGVTFTGFALAGTNAADFALPLNCCAPVVQRTSGLVVPTVVPTVVAAVVPVVTALALEMSTPEVLPSGAVTPPEGQMLEELPSEAPMLVEMPTPLVEEELTTPATAPAPIPVTVPVAPPAPTAVPVERPHKKDRS